VRMCPAKHDINFTAMRRFDLLSLSFAETGDLGKPVVGQRTFGLASKSICEGTAELKQGNP